MNHQFKDLRGRTLKIFSGLDDSGIDESLRDIGELIKEIRSSLTHQGQIGPWEAAELNDADLALEAGFPKLAFIAAVKAIAISQLGQDEYIYGFKSAHRSIQHISFRKEACLDEMNFKERTAADLLAEHKNAALALFLKDEDAARTLESSEQKSATDLKLSQQEAASALKTKNETAAAALLQEQTAGLEVIKAADKRERAHHFDLGQYISLISGGYSVSTRDQDKTLSGNAHDELRETQKKTAQELKANQEKTAEALNVEQTRRAAFLKDAQSIIATSLAMFQQKTAITLVERQMIDAIRKKNAELESANNSGIPYSRPENDKT